MSRVLEGSDFDLPSQSRCPHECRDSGAADDDEPCRGPPDLQGDERGQGQRDAGGMMRRLVADGRPQRRTEQTNHPGIQSGNDATRIRVATEAVVDPQATQREQ